ncbi:arylesterase [Alteromonas flava]|uniref:arylesterase n=1 Tax=Alteromonas flava TaxID=2048003 RepID=UPI001F0C8706|nr:arylesterase [Alteromonas flava]
MVNLQRNRRGAWIVLALLFLPLLAVSDHIYAASQRENVRLLVLGDSLSAAYGLQAPQGWVSLLQNTWQENGSTIDVINAAISGETTDGGLARLPRLLEQHAPTHLLIELGGNDGLQGHNVNKMRVNLLQMVKMAQAQDIEVLLQEMHIPTNYGRRYNELFTESFSYVANKTDIPLIPFFLMDVALDPSLMQRDGIHPNAEAQPIIAEFMRKQLEPLLLDNND